MAGKEVKVQVNAEVNDSKVKELDAEVNRLKQQQLQLRIDANSAELKDTESRIKSLKTFLDNVNTGNTNIHIDDSEIQKAKDELDTLEGKKVNLEVAVAKDELARAKAEEEALNGTAHVDIEVDDAAVQGAMQNLNDGINQAKQGIGELASGFGEVLSAAGSADQNQAFLQIGFDKAGSKNAVQDAQDAQKQIQDIVAKAPGDDTAMNSILSSAVAKDVKLMDKDMQGFANSVSDYFAGAEVNGKHAAEAIQDVRSYITSGNVAELQTTGIFDESQLNELKDIDSVTDRVAKFQEMVGKSSYSGLGTADTLNNKMAEFDGMLEKSATSLGSFFTDGTKGAADLFLGFNDLTGGMAGMALVAAQQFGPGLFGAAQGIFTMVPGIQTLLTRFGGLSGIMGSVTGAISGAGSGLMALATGPVGIAIAAIALLAIGIYEAGKAFGWWKDVGTMFEAIKAGVMSLWDAFMSNQYVIQAIDMIKQGLTDAWNAISGFGQAIMSALSGAGGQFDILSWAINGLQTVLDVVGPLVILAIQGMIQHFRNIYTVGQMVWPYVASIIQGAISTVTGIINGAKAVFDGLVGVWNNVSSAVGSMCSAITGGLSAAGDAWNGFKDMVMSAAQPILDTIHQIQNVGGDIWNMLTGGGGGIEMPVVSSGGYSGGGTTTISQGNTIIFNMYGDIRDEKTLDETIDAINNRIQFEGLANGTNIDNNGSGAI